MCAKLSIKKIAVSVFIIYRTQFSVKNVTDETLNAKICDFLHAHGILVDVSSMRLCNV